MKQTHALGYRGRFAVSAALAAALCTATVATAPPGRAAAVDRVLWQAERSFDYISDPTPDTSITATVVSRACLSWRDVYAARVSTWTAPRARTVVAETTGWSSFMQGVSASTGLAVVRADGSVPVCLVGEGLKQSSPVSVRAGEALTLVEFVPEDPSYVVQAADLVDVTGTKPPANDTLGGAKVITSLPFTTKVDVHLATSDHVNDWSQVNDLSRCRSIDARSNLGYNRTVWFRYSPTVKQTVVLTSSVRQISPRLGEVLSSGTLWQACSGAPATLLPGHTYVVQVGDQTYDAPRLYADIVPAKVAIRPARASTAKAAVTLDAAALARDVLSGTVTCPVGRTFEIRGTATESGEYGMTWTFTRNGTCTGGPVTWTGPTESGLASEKGLTVVAVLTDGYGQTTVVGPAVATSAAD